MHYGIVIAAALLSGIAHAQQANPPAGQPSIVDCGCNGNPKCLALCTGGLGSGTGNGGVGTQAKGGLGSLLGTGAVGMQKISPNMLQGMKPTGP